MVVDIDSTVILVDGCFDDVLLLDVVFSKLETRGDVAVDCLVDLLVSEWEEGNVKGRVKLLYEVVEIFVKSGEIELWCVVMVLGIKVEIVVLWRTLVVGGGREVFDGNVSLEVKE